MPDEALLAVKERAAAQLMRIPGVTGVGIGGRLRDGRPTGELVLKVYVERKRPLADLTHGETLPTEFEGVGIDVGVLGTARLGAAVVTQQQGAPPQQLPGSPLVPQLNADAKRYRPLRGGVRIQPGKEGAGVGTFGCVLFDEADNTKFYVLTNYHVVAGIGKGAPLPEPTGKAARVGQPNNQDSVTKCCSSLFGTYVAGSGASTPTRDDALIRLDPGMEYLTEIEGLGVITGMHEITDAEAASQTYAVRKRGHRTRATGGFVESINTTVPTADDGFTRNNVTVVSPFPNAAVPAADALYFFDQGDSGSVLVNDAGEVVALMYVRLGAVENGRDVFKGGGLPIKPLIDETYPALGIQVRIHAGTTPGVVHKVPGATTVALPQELVPALTGLPAGEAVRVPVDVPWPYGTPAPTPLLMARITHGLDGSEAGRRLVSLWLEHGHELVTLLGEHRRVAVVWHRCGGPALLQLFLRMAHEPGLAFPETLNGRPIGESVDRIADAFGTYASPGLRAALAEARATLPDIGGLTFGGLLTALEGGGR